MSKVQLWFRQPKESEKVYEYFWSFINLSPAERNNRRVAEEYTVSEQNIKQIRRRWNWNERALAYDNHLASAATRCVTKAVEKAEFDWATWEIASLEKTREATDKLFSKVEEILKLKVVQTEINRNQIFDNKTGEPILDSEGKPIYQQVIIIKPLKFRAGDAIRFTEAAVILTDYLVARQRKLLTKANSNQIIPEMIKPLEEMTDGELQEYIEKCRQLKETIAKGERVDFNTLGV